MKMLLYPRQRISPPVNVFHFSRRINCKLQQFTTVRVRIIGKLEQNSMDIAPNDIIGLIKSMIDKKSRFPDMTSRDNLLASQKYAYF